jgi:hypothetical protein
MNRRVRLTAGLGLNGAKNPGFMATAIEPQSPIVRRQSR